MEPLSLNHPFGKGRRSISRSFNHLFYSFLSHSDFIADCPNARDEQICADCTFESDTCQWLDVSNGTFAWTRDQGINVVSLHAGPAIDRKYSLILPYLTRIFCI